ncbi:MAG TPA: LLM class flavin-dependent oxidoreductase [Aestuariivirga sp.]
MEIGMYTFADIGPAISAGQRLNNLIEEIELADQVGLDVYGVGEHHRPDYAASAPTIVLAAAAARTKNIRLTSAVTVLSSDDPVRVYQNFATLDLLSNGRAEIMVGRGSFIESYPLFGYDLNDYDVLFSEKLDLLLKLRAQEHVSWSGTIRAPLNKAGIYPRAKQNPLPVWVGVGGTPQSVVRAGTLGLPMALAIIGGEPARFKPHADLFRESAKRAGHSNVPLSLNMHGFVADDAKAARDTFFPGYAEVMTRIGRERGWPPTTRAQFEDSCGPRGHLIIGNPQDVADKIIALHKIFGNDRILVQMGLGSLRHRDMLRAIELMGKEVAPLVRKAVGAKS